MNKTHKPDLNKTNILTLKKIRNDWGGVKPYTRVKESAKAYNRKKKQLDTE